jgi:hypothetical protein
MPTSRLSGDRPATGLTNPLPVINGRSNADRKSGFAAQTAGNRVDHPGRSGHPRAQIVIMVVGHLEFAPHAGRALDLDAVDAAPEAPP